VRSHVPDAELLRRVGIFADLDREVLDEVVSAIEVETLAADRDVFAKGDPGDCLYVLASGRVTVHDSGRQLEELRAGDMFGEMALIDHEERSASVTTLEPCTLYRLDQEPFYQLLTERPGVARGIIQMLSRRLRARLRDIADDKRYITQLYQASTEHDRLTSELQLAAKVQAGFLPQTLPTPEGWQMSAVWHPAREVSGDFYDVVESAGRLDVVIADVADKGMSAALFMAITRSTLRSSLAGTGSLSRGVAGANRLLSADAANGMFVTLFLARLDIEGGGVSYVNAGHNPPLLYRAADATFTWLTRTGLLVGFDPDAPFEERRLTLDPGDLLLLYTDGVTETHSPQGELYGEERLEALLRSLAANPPDQLVATLVDDLDRFRGSAPIHDDVTVVAIRRS
jgi:CRP-like cAMP-binding protein